MLTEIIILNMKYKLEEYILMYLVFICLKHKLIIFRIIPQIINHYVTIGTIIGPHLVVCTRYIFYFNKDKLLSVFTHTHKKNYIMTDMLYRTTHRSFFI